MMSRYFPKARPNPDRPRASRRERAPGRARTHPFVDSRSTTWNGERICGREDCGAVESARCHALPVTPEHVAESEARRLGEGGRSD